MIHTSKCVKKFFQPEIEKMGFEYKFHDSEIWRFIRMKEDIEQRIDLDFFYCNTALRLYFGTNAYGRHPIDASEIASKDEYPCNILEMLPYSTEEELINWLQMCVQICKKYANKVLEEISTPISKYWPSEDMQIELYEKHSSLLDELKTIYHIDENSSEEDYIDAIESLIESISEESREIFQQGIIRAAVLLGELYISKINGDFCRYDRFCIIKTVENKPELWAYPINDIYLSWKEKDYDCFLNHYNYVKNKFYTVNEQR